MSKALQKLLPWNWFRSKRIAEEDTSKAKKAVAGVKRKRDDDLNPAMKKQKLSKEKLQRATQERTQTGSKLGSMTTGQTGYWTQKDYEQWMIGSGLLHRRPNPSFDHTATIADFDSRTQSQNNPANGSTPTALTQSNQGPHMYSEETQPGKLSRPSHYSMPPPATPAKKGRQARRPRVSDVNPGKTGTEHDTEDVTVMSLAPTTASKRRALQPDAFDLEQARRHAAAVELPSNSGIWALSEKQLFYHLALRGFEPLLPQNWMVDFKTLPLSLFANEHTDPPLIQVHHGTNFRAVRALRSLVETGKLVRDKSLAGPNFFAEKTVEKSVKDYFAWALSDSGFDLSHPQYIPTYTILTRKKGQPTASAIELLNAKLRSLASQHRQRLGILSSIESSPPTSFRTAHFSSESTTQVYDDTLPHEPPVLVGVLIVSAIAVVFTLNGYNSLGEGGDSIDNTGLRFIAKFDFSHNAYDVWNAIAVAITVVHVREGMERFGAGVKDEAIDGSGERCLGSAGELERKIKREAGDDEEQEETLTQSEKGKGKSKGKGKGKGKEIVNEGWFEGEGYEDATLVVDDDPDL